MFTQVKPRSDHATQLDEFLITLQEIADQYTWTDHAGCIRATDADGQRYCPLSAIVSSLYYHYINVDGISAGRYLGISSYTVSHIINAADGAWDSAEDFDLNVQMREAVGL